MRTLPALLAILAASCSQATVPIASDALGAGVVELYSSRLLGQNVQSISDSHGTWFGTDQGIYLYTGSAFMRVSNTPGYPANGCL
jgi:hypothetical protein